ncbi:MAG TPA: MmcQ/YjbR family DNA-binding protein [Candidatus Acidoferrales bacterium]|nr:MmcQ/YjbR family DNA-binding protein [Candidatus Acidoferrales bacterium]
MSTPAPLLRLRELCLTFPEVREDADGVGNPSFKVAGKIFVMHVVNHHGDGKTAFWCKAREGAQLALTTSEPESYFVPPYVGRYGWVGVWLDRRVDWTEARGLIEDSYRLTAPKRLTRSL